jgi:hypothetical protein
MPRKRPQVLAADLIVLDRAARRYRCPASQRNRVLLERAADPLHRAGVNSKLFGNDADTGPSRSRQSLTDSFLECGGDWGTPQDLVGFLSELHALKIDLFLRQQGLDTMTPAGKRCFR